MVEGGIKRERLSLIVGVWKGASFIDEDSSLIIYHTRMICTFIAFIVHRNVSAFFTRPIFATLERNGIKFYLLIKFLAVKDFYELMES